MAEDDWDLQAVVRGCTANSSASCSTTTTAATTINNNSSFSTGLINSCIFPNQQQDDYFHRMQDLYSRNGGDSVDLFDLYKPFYRKSSPPLSPQSIIPISPLSDLGLQDLSHHQNHQMFKQKQNSSAAVGGAGGGGGPSRSTKSSNASSSSSSHTQKYSRGKKRKNQLKKVIEIPADALSSDMWSWRKYGQKPIKGSPYPRGYYRCSTSKGCLARKQVERSRSDPGMFIVTYTSEHNHPMPTHRNSLAGSSRQKPASSGEPSKQSGTRSSPPVSPLSVSLSPEDGDENMSMMNLEDDFFDGLEEIAGMNNLAGISNGFSQTIQFPWLTNNATTTAAGGI